MTSARTGKIPAKPAKETVYLEVDDEITTVIDKVELAKEKIVALVLPKRFTTLQSIVNMRLLKRAAETSGKSIVLITNEASILPLAGAVKLHVAKNLQSKPELPPLPKGALETGAKEPLLPDNSDEEAKEAPAKLDYHRSIGELAAAHAGEEPETIDLEDTDKAKTDEKPALPLKDKRLKVPNFDRFRVMLGLGLLGIILLIVFLILALTVWPKAVITIKTASTPVSASIDLTTSDSAKALDEAKGVIPGVVKTTQQTVGQQVQATGQQNNGEKATGTVTVSASCPTPIADLNAGIGMLSSGLTFITTSKLHLANTGQIGGDGNWVCKGDVSVKAQQGGAKYNLAAGSTFTVQGYPGLSGQNSSALTGGTDNIVTIVSQSDVDAVKQKISSADADAFTKNFEDQLAKAGYYVLTSTLKPSEPAITANPAVGQPATTTTVTIQITYTVVAITKSDLSKALTDALNKQIDSKKQKLTEGDVLSGATVSVQSQSGPAAVLFTASQSTTAVPVIDIASLKKQVGGQKSGDIRAALGGLPGVKSVDVKLSPFWVSKAPKNVKHVHIVLQQVKSSGGG